MPECTDCGACCFNEHAEYIRVFLVDYERMNDAALALSTEKDGVRYMRFEDGHCAALGFDSATNRVGCTIYPMRPDACRWLERGSGECRSQLASKWPAREREMDAQQKGATLKA